MPSVVPHAFLFRYSFPVPHCADVPQQRRPLDLPDECLLPHPARLDRDVASAEIRLAWNARGLAVAARVSGRSAPPHGNAAMPVESEGLQIWIDTRNTQSIHRASRFCHHFCLLPRGGGKGRDPLAVQVPIARAKDEAPLAKPGTVNIAADVAKDGYALGAWIPAEALHGYDPETSPRLGFYYYLRDWQRGDQYLTVDEEFPFGWDPSLWSTLELVPGR